MSKAHAGARLLDAQSPAARAKEMNARPEPGSEIGGVDASAAQLQAQRAQAEWELGQTGVPQRADVDENAMSGDMARPRGIEPLFAA